VTLLMKWDFYTRNLCWITAEHVPNLSWFTWKCCIGNRTPKCRMCSIPNDCLEITYFGVIL